MVSYRVVVHNANLNVNVLRLLPLFMASHTLFGHCFFTSDASFVHFFRLSFWAKAWPIVTKLCHILFSVATQNIVKLGQKSGRPRNLAAEKYLHSITRCRKSESGVADCNLSL